jgi:hypothetical protein
VCKASAYAVAVAMDGRPGHPGASHRPVTLWGSTPTITPLILLLLTLERLLSASAGRATEPGNPLLGRDLTHGARRERSPKMSHNQRLDSRDRERPTEHLDNSLARPLP